MRAVLPIRCPKCGFESFTVAVCTFCGTKLQDAEGRVVPPHFMVERGKSQRDLATVIGLGATGMAMVVATLIAHGPVLAPIGVGVLTGLGVWALARRGLGAKDDATRWICEALAVAASPVGDRVALTGRVHVLRSAITPEGEPVAAYRNRELVERTLAASRRFSDKPHVVTEARERHAGGRFAVVGPDGIGIVDDDWLLVAVPAEPPELMRGASLVTIREDDEVTVVGPATRGPAEEAARFAPPTGYRETADALIFDGREGAPVVVIVRSPPRTRVAS